MPDISATVLFVRHGETTANRDGVIQGSGCDFPLTEKGQDEAVKVGLALNNVHWDIIYSSDLQRTLATTDILLSQAKALGCQARPTPVLR